MPHPKKILVAWILCIKGKSPTRTQCLPFAVCSWRVMPHPHSDKGQSYPGVLQQVIWKRTATMTCPAGLTNPGFNSPPPKQQRNFLNHPRIKWEKLLDVLLEGDGRFSWLLLSGAGASLLPDAQSKGLSALCKQHPASHSLDSSCWKFTQKCCSQKFKPTVAMREISSSRFLKLAALFSKHTDNTWSQYFLLWSFYH